MTTQEIKLIQMENRVHQLTMKDPVTNAKIIAKLKRRIRSLKSN